MLSREGLEGIGGISDFSGVNAHFMDTIVQDVLGVDLAKDSQDTKSLYGQV